MNFKNIIKNKLRLGFALSLVTIGILSTSTLSILNDNYSSPNNIPSDSSAELYSTGMEAGYGATPFVIGHTSAHAMNSTAYVGSDGYLYAAGYNNLGKLGNGSTTSVSTHFPMYKSGSNTTANYFYQPIDYDIGAYFSMVIDNDGKVWTAGDGSGGQLGQGDTTTDNYFTKVATGTGTYDLPSNYSAVAVSASGSHHSLILTDDGYLYGAGYQYSIGVGTTTTAQSTFTRLDGVATNLPVAGGAAGDIVDFGAGNLTSFVLYENGDLYRCYSTNSFTKVASDIKMFDIAGSAYGGYSAFMVSNSNVVYELHNTLTTPSTLLSSPSGTISQIRGWRNYAVSGYVNWGYLNDKGDLYLSSAQSTDSTSAPSLVSSDIAYFDMLGDSNDNFFGALTTAGVLKFWGVNDNGQLGNGTTSTGAITFANGYTPTVGGGVDPDYGNLPQVQTDLQSTPPALTKLTGQATTGTSVTWEKDTTISMTYGNYLAMDYSFYDEKLANDSYIQVKVEGTKASGTAFSTEYVINQGDYSKQNTKSNYPVDTGTYTITSQLYERPYDSSTGVYGDLEIKGNPNVVSYEITDASLSFSGNGSSLYNYLNNIDDVTGAATTQVVLLNDTDILNTASLLHDGKSLKSLVEDGIKDGTYSSIGTMYSTNSTPDSSGYFTELTTGAVANKWEIIWTTSSTMTSNNVTSITSAGTYYVRFRLSNIDGYAESTTWQTVAFTVAARENVIQSSQIGIISEYDFANRYQSTNIAGNSVGFGDAYYVNITNSVYLTQEEISYLTIGIAIKDSSNTEVSSFHYTDDQSGFSATDLPRTPATYTIEVTVIGADGHNYGTVSNTFEITKNSITIAQNGTALSSYLENLLIVHDVNNNKTNLIDGIDEKIVTEIKDNDMITITELYSIIGDVYGKYPYDLTTTEWIIYFTATGSASAARLDNIDDAGTYYVWVQFVVDNNANLSPFYTNSNQFGFSFVIKTRDISIAVTDFGFTTDTEQYNNEVITSVMFASSFYVNVKDVVVDNDTISNGDYIVQYQIYPAGSDSFTWVTYSNLSSNESTYAALAKGVGNYTMNLRVIHKEDSHYYGSQTTTLTIISNTPTLEWNDTNGFNTLGAQIQEDLGNILLVNDTNLVDKLSTVVLTGIQANTSYIKDIALSEEDPSKPTDLITRYFRSDVDGSKWIISFSNVKSSTLSQRAGFEITTDGTYYAFFYLEAPYANYNDSNELVIEFKIANRSVSVSANSFGIQYASGDGASDMWNTNQLYSTMSFGVKYYINNLNSNYSDTSLYKQMLTITTENGQYVIDYNTLTSNEDLWNHVAKTPGTYSITLQLMSSVDGDPHIYGTGYREYTITDVSLSIGVVPNSNLSTYLSETQTINDINLMDALKSKILTSEVDGTKSFLQINTSMMAVVPVDPSITDVDKTFGTNGNNNTLESTDITGIGNSLWNINFTAQGAANTSANWLTTVSSAGTYTVYISLTDVYGYQDSNTITLNFSIISGPEVDFQESSIGISIGENQALYATETVFTVGFGENYFINIDSNYFASGTYTQMVYVTKTTATGDDIVVNEFNYNSTTKNTSLWKQLPKEVGTYQIHLTITDVVNDVTMLILTPSYTITEGTVVFEFVDGETDKLIVEELAEIQVCNGDELFGLITNAITAGLLNSNSTSYVEMTSGLKTIVYSGTNSDFDDITLQQLTSANWNFQIFDAVSNLELFSITEAGTYVIYLTLVDVDNYFDSQVVSIEFQILPRTIEGSDTTGGFNASAFGASTSQDKYADESSATIDFGTTYYLNIASELFSDTSIYTQDITIEGTSFSKVSYEYSSAAYAKVNATFVNHMPKLPGVYTITLTVVAISDGHEYGTLTTTLTITEVASSFETLDFDEAKEGNFIYDITMGNKIEVGGGNIYTDVLNDIKAGFGTSWFLGQDLFSYATNNTLSSIAQNLNTHFTIDIKMGNSVLDTITTEGTYKVVITFVGIEYYNSATLEFDLELIERPFFTTGQIGIVYYETTTFLNEVEFAKNYDGATNSMAGKYFVEFNNPYITTSTHEIIYTITGTSDSGMAHTVAYSGDYVEGHTDEIWQDIMPKAPGTYTVTVRITDKSDGITTSNSEPFTFKVVENTSFALSATSGTTTALNNLFTFSGKDIVEDVKDTLLAELGVSINLSMRLWGESAQSTRRYSDLEEKNHSLYTYEFYNQLSGGSQGAKITEITSEGSYIVVMTFNGVGNYAGGTSISVAFSIAEFDALSAGNLLVYSMASNDLSDLVYASDVTDGYYFFFERVAPTTGSVFNSGNSAIIITVTAANSAYPSCEVNYYNYDQEAVWQMLPKDAGTHTVSVWVDDYRDSDNRIEYTFTKTYTIAENTSFSLSTKSDGTSIQDDVTLATSTIVSTQYDSTITLTDVKSITDDVNSAIANTFNQAGYYASTAYTSNNADGTATGFNGYTEINALSTANFVFTYVYVEGSAENDAAVLADVTEGNIRYAGTYRVTVGLELNNYIVATVNYRFTIQELIGLSNNLLQFYQFGNYTNTVDYYTGTEYTIGFDASRNDNINTILVTNANEFVVTIRITGSLGFDQVFVYNLGEDYWDYMPKRAGDYEITVSVQQTILGVTYDALVAADVHYLSILGGVDTEFADSTSAIQDVLKGAQTRPTLVAGEIVLEDTIDGINTMLSNKISDDLFTILASSNNTEVSKYALTVNATTGQHEMTLVTYDSNDFEFSFYSQDSIYSTKLNTITTEGTYYLFIQFKGYSTFIDGCDYLNGTLIEFSITERVYLENDSVFFDTTMFIDGDETKNIDFYNGGNAYWLYIQMPTDYNLLEDSQLFITISDENGNVMVSYQYFDESHEYGGTATYAFMPKAAGTYTIDIKVVHSDEFETTSTSEVYIDEINLNINATESLAAPELAYTSKSLGTTVSEYYLNEAFFNFTVDGVLATEIYTVSEDGLSFVKVELTADSFEIRFFDENGNEVLSENLIEDGTYTAVISLKDDANVGYANPENGESSFTTTFTIAPYAGSIDIRGVVIALAAVLAIIIIIIVRKKRTS